MTRKLERFVEAQRYMFPTALAEIKAGCKENHWMWYIFPQIKGLGYSSTAQYYAIENLEEAKEYLANELLRNNLITICNALLELEGVTAEMVFGLIDSLKLKSSMTLFSIVAPDNDVFVKVLAKYYNGEKDEKTIEILNKQDSTQVNK